MSTPYAFARPIRDAMVHAKESQERAVLAFCCWLRSFSRRDGIDWQGCGLSSAGVLHWLGERDHYHARVWELVGLTCMPMTESRRPMPAGVIVGPEVKL